MLSATLIFQLNKYDLGTQKIGKIMWRLANGVEYIEYKYSRPTSIHVLIITVAQWFRRTVPLTYANVSVGSVGRAEYMFLEFY